MPGKRKTPEMRQHQILAAADLLLLEVGIDKLSISQVASRAKIAKGTVYHHYKNKDSLLADLGAKALGLLHQHFVAAVAMHESHLDKVGAICRSCFDFDQRYPKYFKLISFMERPEFDINTSGYLNLSRTLQQFTHDIILKGQEKGEIKAGLDAQTIHYIIWAACMGVVDFVETKKRLLENHHAIDSRSMVETFANILTEGIKA